MKKILLAVITAVTMLMVGNVTAEAAEVYTTEDVVNSREDLKVKNPWILEEKTFAVEGRELSHLSFWYFNGALKVPVSVQSTDDAIISLVKAFQEANLRYLYKYDEELGLTLPNTEYDFKWSYDLMAALQTKQPDIVFEISTFNIKGEIIETVRLYIPLDYETDVPSSPTVTPEPEETKDSLGYSELENYITYYGDIVERYTYPKISTADCLDTLDLVNEWIEKFEKWQLTREGITQIYTWGSVKKDVFLKENVIRVDIDYIFEEGYEGEKYRTELLFPIEWFEKTIPHCNQFMRTNHEDKYLNNYTKNVMRFDTASSMEEVFQNFEAIHSQLEIFVPENVNMEFLHDVMFDYHGEGTGMYTVLVEFSSKDTTLEYLELFLPFLY